MREIKFRAWIKVSQKIASWEMIKEKKNLHRLIENPEYLLMQYTGLKDKNGIEIYEGDIIKKGTDIVLVKYSEYHTSFQVYFRETNAPIRSLYEFGYSNEIEVIGNIYKNKELLK